MKYRFKKLLILGLITGMFTITFTGCGNAKSTEDNAKNNKIESGADNNSDNIVENNTENNTEISQDGSASINGSASTFKTANESVSSVESSSNNNEIQADIDSSQPEQSDEAKEEVFVEKVEGLSEDFIRGMDASSVLVEENSGVKYYDFNGKEADVFKTLSEAGVNCIRLRVWNDPYDSEGNGYGGGNNDVATAITLGKRATDNNMKVMIDFHYSDFWADPKKQFAPKAWKDMSIDDKCSVLSEFTKDSLNEILDAGVDVGYVQIGNEINNGMSGETSLSNVTKLLDAASKAVRSVSKDKSKEIKIIVHYTNIENNGAKVNGLVDNLDKNAIDYDIVGLSYYPYWHGDFENMQRVVRNLKSKYNKDIMIVETSYPYTTKDGDGSGNSFDGKEDLVEGYSATVQGQAHMIRDIIDYSNEAGAIGVCYWEGVWIPVGLNGANNAPVWEKYGSGWASRYASEYDPDDAGKYYGGCSWDNQAMFDFKGYPLDSLNVFKYVYEGHKAPLKVESVPDMEITVAVGEEIKLPETTPVIYNDPSVKEEIAIVWDEADLSKIDSSKEGKISVHGTLQNEEKNRAICHLVIKDENFVKNPSFEDIDRSMWEITYENATNPTDYQDKKDDAHDGTVALHFWSGREDMDFTLKQTITGLEPGNYELSCFAQGGDMKDTSQLQLFATTKGETLTQDFMMTSWAQWKNPVITNIEVTDGTIEIGVFMKCNVGSWGTVDEFVLKKID
jgi:arabinogalactan endo-1,4-beta-galactosidase